MSLDLPSSAQDLFAQNRTGVESLSLGGVLSQVLRNDPNIRKQMSAIERAAIDQIFKNVGTPGEYDSALEYIVRALPYVRGTYKAIDSIRAPMPNNEEVAILMRPRFI